MTFGSQESNYPAGAVAVTEKTIKTILLIEDNPGDARLIREMFKEQGSENIEFTHVESMQDAEKHLAENTVDIILLDLGLPDVQGLEAVRRAHAAASHIPLVVLSGLNNESLALQTLQQGAQDYLIKGDFAPRDILRALRYAVERKSNEEKLFDEKERAQVTLDCIGDAVICTDLNGNITFLNLVAERLTGWSLLESAGKPMAEAFQIVDGATRKTTPDPMEKSVVQNRSGNLPVNCILIRRDGHEVYIEDSVAPIHDRAGNVTGSVLVFRDVSTAHALAAQIAHLAEHDSLTDLPNRLLLNDRLEQAIAMAARLHDKLAVLFLDLDGFKHINDSLGHPTGDMLLQSVAKRLRDCVRAPDTISRQGGDEFIVLLRTLHTPEDAIVATNRILKAVAVPHSIEHRELHVSASIGVSLYPDDGQDAETLIKNADTAMYQAKESGRHGYKFFMPEMNIRAVERQSIEQDLRSALERNEFTLNYQPKINLKTGEVTGVEALIRWNHPVRGMVPPLQFIPVAEDCGLILPIGAWVLREACTQSRAWTDAGLPPMTMAVNISAAQFRSEGFLEQKFEIMSEVGIDPQFLEVEITESVLMKHTDVAATTLRALRDKGVRVSVDDFGTGYSSLSYLRKFPLDSLKIDQSFVRQITPKPEDAGIVSAIISMGQGLNLRVIAEGVETVEDLAFLKAHNCDEAQGYLFSRPIPASAMVRWLESYRSGLARCA
jgi:diguanylate cyclase (GGDEF)-like protein/PAS domain S-box-containing protein